jgi:hypothetical protein
MARWVETGCATHAEANRVRCQLLEDYPLNDDEAFEVDCYAVGQGQFRYGVKVISVQEQAIARAEYEEDR